ncbi:hypothetical protein F5884DRAFT_820787 [Xylogone sp. PMI_703]|nr:hypothetical protein F5884DRAFT_820787 [Xylogone sp. PMI_703]
MDRAEATGQRILRKRKADTQDNERLSKRLSLLNLEKNGQMLYVPVEEKTEKRASKPPATAEDDDSMQLDNSKHKVYIYNLDDELSDSDSDDGKLIFLPDIEKHLRESRIPPSVLANSKGELAGNNMQLILYKPMSEVLGSLEQDKIRKAIAETRTKARAKHEEERQTHIREAQDPLATIQKDIDNHCSTNGVVNGILAPGIPIQQEPIIEDIEPMEEDPDAMEIG